jgi:hypothetical protein
MTEASMSEKRLLSKSEFCAAYGIKHTGFYRLVNTGALAALKIGTRTYVAIEEAERWRASLPTYTPAARHGADHAAVSSGKTHPGAAHAG